MTFKASGTQMGSGREALETAAKNIESARAELETAYGRLQKQWQSSEARGRADHEYAQLMEWLRSSIEWARAAASTTADADDMFHRVETSGVQR